MEKLQLIKTNQKLPSTVVPEWCENYRAIVRRRAEQWLDVLKFDKEDW